MSKKVKKVMSKYDFDFSLVHNSIDYSEVVTVPDQVLSMYDIYQKYAVRGEIAGLANNIRPHTSDDLDDFDDAVDFVPEEDLDILQRSKAFRMVQEAEASSKGQSGLEDKPQDKPQDKNEDPSGSDAKPLEPAVDPDADAGSK